MKIDVGRVVDKLVWVLITLLLAVFVLFETFSLGRYVFLAITLLILVAIAIVNRGKIKIRLQAYHYFFVLFTVFVFISAAWSWRPAATIGKTTTLFLVLICSSVIYVYYQAEHNVHKLLTAVMWSGYLVSLYTIFFYGTENFGADVEIERLGNAFANVNSIGMCAALSCVLQFNEILHKRNVWSIVMAIPSLYVIAATQSRKALVFLVGGVYAIYVLKTLSKKISFSNILRISGYTLVFVFGAYLVLKLPAFAGVMDRMEALLPGNGGVEASADIRSEMVQIGIESFKQHPVVGIGVGSSGVLTKTYLFKDTYLHNNFVELLACGGIIGFVCYYVIYAYLFYNLIKYRKSAPEYFAIGITWLSIMFIMNYGMVTYYEKLEWYFLMIHFLNVKCLREKGKGMQNEYKENR